MSNHIERAAFNGHNINIIMHQGEPHMTGEAIGKALDYNNPRIAIQKIYQRNQEMLDEYSCVTKLVTQGDTQRRDTRIYSEQGMMFITMKSNQPAAMPFQRWGLQVMRDFRHSMLDAPAQIQVDQKPLNFSPYVYISHGHPVTTSINIAKVFGKQHYHVLDAINNQDIPEEFRAPNFRAAKYLDAQKKPRPMYEMSRDGFVLIAMGFTGKPAMQFKIKYIELFNAMESELVAPRGDFPRLDVANAALLEENNQLKDELLAMHRKYLGQIEKPKVKRKVALPVTAAEVSEMRRLHSKGMSNADIARKLGRSGATVSFSVRGGVA